MSMNDRDDFFRSTLPSDVSRKTSAPVITPIPSVLTSSGPTDRTPRWDKWKLIPQVPLWQAVALSLDIDPEHVQHGKHQWLAGPGSPRTFEESTEFRDRFEVAQNRLNELNVTASDLARSDPKIALTSFARLADKCTWSLPAEFPRETVQIEHWKREDLWSEADLQALCCGLVPEASRPNTAALNEAAEAIRRGILACALAVASEPADATQGDRMYGHARFFRPREATVWATQRFTAFPFKVDEFDDPGSTGEHPTAPSKATWPWGSYETPLLRHLAAAAEHWWVRYTPEDETTAPTNEEVANWLMERGVHKSMAEKMATILRVEGLKPGPRT